MGLAVVGVFGLVVTLKSIVNQLADSVTNEGAETCFQDMPPSKIARGKAVAAVAAAALFNLPQVILLGIVGSTEMEPPNQLRAVAALILSIVALLYNLGTALAWAQLRWHNFGASAGKTEDVEKNASSDEGTKKKKNKNKNRKPKSTSVEVPGAESADADAGAAGIEETRLDGQGGYIDVGEPEESEGAAVVASTGEKEQSKSKRSKHDKSSKKKKERGVDAGGDLALGADVIAEAEDTAVDDQGAEATSTVDGEEAFGGFGDEDGGGGGPDQATEPGGSDGVDGSDGDQGTASIEVAQDMPAAGKKARKTSKKDKKGQKDTGKKDKKGSSKSKAKATDAIVESADGADDDGDQPSETVEADGSDVTDGHDGSYGMTVTEVVPDGQAAAKKERKTSKKDKPDKGKKSKKGSSNSKADATDAVDSSAPDTNVDGAVDTNQPSAKKNGQKSAKKGGKNGGVGDIDAALAGGSASDKKSSKKGGKKGSTKGSKSGSKKSRGPSADEKQMVAKATSALVKKLGREPTEKEVNKKLRAVVRGQATKATAAGDTDAVNLAERREAEFACFQHAKNTGPNQVRPRTMLPSSFAPATSCLCTRVCPSVHMVHPNPTTSVRRNSAHAARARTCPEH